ncbi:MAG: hypothetical protein HY314_02200 [Acidobacteria bacterium]|nr:hypothetical protein [Acidobacteriota bacterium]
MALTSLHSIFLIPIMLLNLIGAPMGQEPTIERKIQQMQRHFTSLALERDEGDLVPTGTHLRTILGETEILLQECERKMDSGEFPSEEIALLQGQHEQLTLLNQELQAIFQTIESKLTEAGLSSKISTLKEFVQYSQGRMSALQTQVAALIQSDKNVDDRAAASQIKLLRSSLARLLCKDEDLRASGIELSPVPPFAVKALSPYAPEPHQPMQNDQPTPDHLAESAVVQLTPTIRTKAADLGNSPVRIYEYVRNSFEFEPYTGMLQNSQSVFWSGRGNDFDLATLLIALLRAANIPARYVNGRIRLPIQQVMNWIGVKDRQVALSILAIVAATEPDGDAVRFNHRWVEAYVLTAQGQRWVALDPSFKLKSYQTGIQIPKLPFDRMQYISSVKTALSTELYVDQIRQYLRQNHPGRALSDVPYTGRVIPVETGALPSALPFEVETIFSKPAEFARTAHHRVIVSVVDPANDSALVRAELSIPEVSLQSITITFGAASSSDQKTIDLFGGLTNTPAFLAAVVPQIRLDGTVIASGTSGPPMGELVEWVVTYLYPSRTEPLFEVSNLLRVSEIASIGLDAHQINDRFLSYRIDRLVSGSQALGTGDQQQPVGEILHIAAMRWYQRLAAERRRVADPLQLKIGLVGAEEATTFSTLEVTTLFDRPFVLTPSQLSIDGRGHNRFLYDINSSATNTPELKNYLQMFGLTASALEHELWEEVALIPSMSTTKTLQVASENRIPIRIIDRSNAATELPRLQIPDSFRQDMQADINAGKTILTPQRLVTFRKWEGLGWISESANGIGTYWLRTLRLSKTGGGTTGDDPTGQGPGPGPEGDPTGTNGTACGLPVTVSNGNMFHQFEDLNISSRGFPIVLRQTYNSQSTSDDSFGYGWTHSYNMSLKESFASITFFNDSGGQFTFTRQGNTYSSPPGLNMTLTKDQQGFTLRQKDGTELRFDTRGKLQSITDRNSNTQRLSYDSRGNLQTITDALGRVITFSYNTQNRIVAIQDFAGRRLTYSYDTSGHLIESVDFGGNKTAYTYYSSRFNDHNLKTITDPEGNTITYVYYGNDKVFKTINPGGGEMRFIYLPLRQETLMIDERDFVWTFQYNTTGNVTRIIDPDGNYIDQVWNSDAKLISRTDEAGFTTTFEYDQQGNLLQTTDPLGNKTRFTYELKFSQVTSFTDAKGHLTRVEYDAKGNLTKIIDALGGETAFTYDSFGNILTLTNAEGNTFSRTYDPQDNPVELRDALGNVIKFKFDALRRATSVIDPLNNEFTVEYDSLDRATQVVNPMGNVTSSTYDRNGNVVQSTDANGNVTRLAYDQMSHLTQMTDALGNVTRLGRKIDDCFCVSTPNLSSVTNAQGHSWTYSYNFRGQLTEIRDPLGNITRFAYDARGNPSEKTDPNGNTTRFESDALSRLVRKSFPDGAAETFAYDANGNMLTASNQHVTLTATYDELNRVTSITDSRFPRPIRYTYDRIGNRKTMTDPEAGITTYSYDKNDRLVGITNPKGQMTRFQYDALGRRTELMRANNTRAAYTYDGVSRLLTLVHTNLTTNSVLSQFLYSHDKISNRTSVTDLAGVHRYEYDNTYRLTAATHPASPAERYGYDAVGNRMRSATQQDFQYDEADRLLRVDSTAFSYDNNGNTVSRTDAQGTTRYTYDFENQFVRIDFPGGHVATYKYDPFGRRIERTVDGQVTKYFYDTEDILMEFDSRSPMVARYTHGFGIDEPLIMERGGQSVFYHADGLGSVVQLTDISGRSVQSYSYDSFGRVIGLQGGLTNPYTYTGRELDAESGMYYYRHRYYDPAIGRFSTEDPIGLSGGINFYAYVGNNPVNWIDPFGLEWSWEEFWKEVAKGAVAGGIEGARTGATITIEFGDRVEIEVGGIGTVPSWAAGTVVGGIGGGESYIRQEAWDKLLRDLEAAKKEQYITQETWDKLLRDLEAAKKEQERRRRENPLCDVFEGGR